jgi:hypothetical protein
MIYDHRTYTCRPGTIAKHLKLYEESGWHIQKKHLGDPVVYAATETGDVNSYIHIWVYDSASDRAQKRANLKADPEWQAYLKKSADAGYLISQVNKILMPTAFFQS